MSNLEETSSFILRFTQQIYEDEPGKHEVRWRGYIRHVQGGDEKRFSDFAEAFDFLQAKMAEMTLDATQEKSEEEQEGILTQSFSLWKKMTKETPKLLFQTLKDPKKQVEHFQQQLQHFNEDMNAKIEQTIQKKINPEDWKYTTKADFQLLLDEIKSIKQSIKDIEHKLDNK